MLFLFFYLLVSLQIGETTLEAFGHFRGQCDRPITWLNLENSLVQISRRELVCCLAERERAFGLAMIIREWAEIVKPLRFIATKFIEWIDWQRASNISGRKRAGETNKKNVLGIATMKSHRNFTETYRNLTETSRNPSPKSHRSHSEVRHRKQREN